MFDTLDHSNLVARVQQLVGTCASVLDWFRSWQAQLCVSASVVLGSALLDCYGVPQGSILGSLTVSAAPGFHLEKARYRITFHLFADNSRIYVPPKKRDALSLQPLLLCLEDINDRVSLNRIE